VRKLATCGVVFACVVLAACGGDGGDSGDVEAGTGAEAVADPNAFEGNGYSFTYPGEWEEQHPEAASDPGSEHPMTYVGLDNTDVWGVVVYTYPFSVTKGNIDQYEADLTEDTQSLFEDLDGRLTAGPTSVTIDGLPGLRWEGSLLNVDGVQVQSRFTSLWDASTEYWLNCQFTSEHAEAMKRGCDEVETSFRVR
jgi:hypothetical protein